MIAAYVRVSTDEQNERGQRDAITKWANGRPIQWYADIGQSGKRINRPALKRLLADVEAGKVDTVVAARLDRISRSMLHGVQLIQGLCDAGVRLVILDHDIDLSGVMGRAMAALLFAFAELWLETIHSAQKAGIEAVRRRNGGKCTWGGSEAGRVLVPPEKLEAMRAMRAAGQSCRAIAKVVGVSTASVIKYTSAE